MVDVWTSANIGPTAITQHNMTPVAKLNSSGLGMLTISLASVIAHRCSMSNDLESLLRLEHINITPHTGVQD